MEYIINIGLNNNNYSEAVSHINNAKSYYFKDYHIKQGVSTYNGVIEETIILSFNTEAYASSIYKLLQQWCKYMDQECISMHLTDNENNTFGYLVYNTNYKGKQFTFNNKYFLR
jgi:hypothetical protein